MDVSGGVEETVWEPEMCRKSLIQSSWCYLQRVRIKSSLMWDKDTVGQGHCGTGKLGQELTQRLEINSSETCINEFFSHQFEILLIINLMFSVEQGA